MRFAFIDAWKEVWSVEFLCRIMQVTSRGFRTWRCRPMSRRQRTDMVILTHVREQLRLSLQSYGRPRMSEELQELGLKVGHRRIGRLMCENGIKLIRTQKYKVEEDHFPDDGLTATTRSTLRPTYWIRISLRMVQTKNGWATYPISGPAKGGCIWPSSSICIFGASLVGLSATA
jgi:hypothetical protein